MSLSEPRPFRAEVVAQSMLSPRVRGLSLATRGPDPIDWVPGQYVEVGLPGEAKRMPYSIASAPDPERPGLFELAVLRGSGGGVLDDLVVGGSVEIFGPKGTFVRQEPAGPPEIYVGTGTGLAPLRAMLQAALAAGGDFPLVVLFGARTETEILWRAELEALSESQPRFRYMATLSQPQNGWTGARGRVQDHLADVVVPHPDARIYVCGVSEMVAECVAKLTAELSIPRERVVTEGH
ncbi:MAG: oxidoreductase [Myxococcales bacterium]|nr:oxidoreductase [Myxococcales bacterium]